MGADPVDASGLTDDELLACLPLVRRLAGAVARTSRQIALCDAEELTGVGYLALAAHAPKYRRDRGARPWTFLSIRIRGAMIDWVREASQFSRKRRQSDATAFLPITDLARVSPDPEPGYVARLGFERALERFTPRDRAICEEWREGWTGAASARKYRLSEPRIRQIRRHLEMTWAPRPAHAS